MSAALVWFTHFNSSSLFSFSNFQLDITSKNYVSAENLGQPLVLTEVTNAVFDDSGRWLVTVEYWNDGMMSPELALKFWLYDEEKQRWDFTQYEIL